MALEAKNLSANAGDARSLGGEDPLQEEMAFHFSTPDWKIPQAEEPGMLQSMGSQSPWEHDLKQLSARAHTHTHRHTHILCARY